MSIAFSPYGDLVASGSYDVTVCLWNLFSGAESLVLRGHEGAVRCISFSHDDQRIASGSTDTTVRLWNTTAGAQIFPVLHGHKTFLRAIAFSPDGTKVASANNECVCLWNVISGTRIFIQQVVTTRDFCRSLAFSPDGQHIHIQTSRIMLALDSNNACLNQTPCYLHEVCDIYEPIIITTDGLVVDVMTRRILCKLPSIVSMTRYTASTRSIAFTVGRPSIFVMHFPPCVLTSPMTWDENVYESKPI
jgi:hypothetical protein